MFATHATVNGSAPIAMTAGNPGGTAELDSGRPLRNSPAMIAYKNESSLNKFVP